jgi:MFS family permease
VIFGLSALFGVLHMVVVLVLTRGDVHVRPSETPHALRLLFRHWPGGTVWVAIAHGVVFSVTTVFLTRYVAELKLEGIGVFFLGYAIVAFVSRWSTREWGQTIGRHSMLIRGLISMVTGLLLLLPVRNQWMLVPSAMACGFGAALIFPALLSLGAGRFPVHHRGTGTTLVLGFIDLGTIVASPILGRLIDFGNVWARRDQLPYEHLGFTLMLTTSATGVLVVLVYYWLVASRVPDVDHYESETIESPVPGGLASGPVVVEEERELREGPA